MAWPPGVFLSKGMVSENPGFPLLRWQTPGLRYFQTQAKPMWHHNGIIQTPVAYQRVPKDPDKHFRGDRTGGGFWKLGRLVFFRCRQPGKRCPETPPKYGGDPGVSSREPDPRALLPEFAVNRLARENIGHCFPFFQDQYAPNKHILYAL